MTLTPPQVALIAQVTLLGLIAVMVMLRFRRSRQAGSQLDALQRRSVQQREVWGADRAIPTDPLQPLFNWDDMSTQVPVTRAYRMQDMAQRPQSRPGERPDIVQYYRAEQDIGV